MTDILYIWVSDDLDQPWYWGDSSGYWGVASDPDEKRGLSEVETKTLTLVLSGQSVKICQPDLPDMNAREQYNAAKFAAEDILGQPIETQHFGIGTSDGSFRLAIISRTKIDYILTQITQYHLQPDCIYADFDILPESSGLLQWGERIICPGQNGYTLDTVWADEIHDHVQPVQFEQLLPLLDTTHAINLRQGDYAKRRDWSTLWSVISPRRMIWSASLLLLLGGVHLANLLADSRALNLQAADWQMQTRQIYESGTGKTAPEGHAHALGALIPMASVSGSQDVLQLSSYAYQLIERVEGVEIDSLSYNESQSGLILKLIYSRFETLTQLENTAAEMGMSLQAGGVRESRNQLVGEVRITIGDGT